MTFFGMALFTALGTVVLAVLAIFTTVYAIRAYRAQSSELKDQRELNAKQTPVLELQAKELQEALAERQREAGERRRAQASGVFITMNRDGMSTTQAQRAAGAMDPGFATARVTNTSKQPVYDLVINWHKGTAPWGDPDTAEVLMPDEHLERMRAFPDDLPRSVDRSVFGAVVRFRDAAGHHWLTGPDGQLTQEAADQ
jgi:hypothetical protein